MRLSVFDPHILANDEALKSAAAAAAALAPPPTLSPSSSTGGVPYILTKSACLTAPRSSCEKAYPPADEVTELPRANPGPPLSLCRKILEPLETIVRAKSPARSDNEIEARAARETTALASP